MSASKINRRRLVVSATAGLGAASMIGRASARPGAPSARYEMPAVNRQSPVQLRWAIPGNPAEVAVYEQVAADFMEQNPDIEVVTDREASDYEKIVSLIAAGTPPDIMFSTINNWPAFAERDIFMALDDFIEQDSYDIEDFYEQILTPYRYDGEGFGTGPLYGLPKEIAVRAMYYNRDIFEEAGVDLPTADEPWTWDQFVEMTQATTKVEGGRTRQYGYILSAGWLYWQIWAWSAGGEPVDDLFKPTRSNLNDPAVLEGYKTFTDFVTELGTAPSSSVTREQGTAEMFAAGLGATYNNGRWMVPLFRESDFAWDVMPHPYKTDRAQMLSGSIFAVSSATEHPEEAWKLLSYVSGTEGQTAMTELGLLLPSRKSVAESDVFLQSTPPESNQIFLDELEFAKPLPLTSKYPEIEKIMNDNTDLVLNGEQTAEEAMAIMHEQVDALLQS
jgi:multiple sugar transport system substrate-binding protein